MKYPFISSTVTPFPKNDYPISPKPVKKVLVASENPPKTYTNALNAVDLDYDFSLSVGNINDYGGLLLIGGGDILPAYYGFSDDEIECFNVNFVKDKLEFNLLYRFIRSGKPVLAICRGFQLVNVFFGGTLKCVSGHMGKGDIYHPVSSVGEIFGGFEKVNSCHRQAVCGLPGNATVLSVAPDLTVEAAVYRVDKNRVGSHRDNTHTDNANIDNIVCVQFHPERLSRLATEQVFGEFKKLISVYR